MRAESLVEGGSASRPLDFTFRIIDSLEPAVILQFLSIPGLIPTLNKCYLSHSPFQEYTTLFNEIIFISSIAIMVDPVSIIAMVCSIIGTLRNIQQWWQERKAKKLPWNSTVDAQFMSGFKGILNKYNYTIAMIGGKYGQSFDSE